MAKAPYIQTNFNAGASGVAPRIAHESRIQTFLTVTACA